MRKNLVIVTIILTFLWLNGISESGTTTVSACTNFKIKDDHTVFFGNSEDQTYSQILETYITFIPRGQVWYDGLTIEYGSVILGYANGSEYSWVQGGMNDQGLAFDSTSVPYTTPNLHNERPPLLIPQIFNCMTIDEVIECINTHSIHPIEGNIQTFFVDRSGESIVYNIGVDGEFAVFRTNSSFQIATNHYVDDPFRGNPSPDSIERYNAAEEKLNDIVTNDVLTVDSITSVLEAVHFEGPNLNTVYSNIFDVTNGDIYLYFFHQFEEVVKLNLEEELAKGRHTYRIADLFTQVTIDNANTEYNAYPFLVRTYYADIILLIGTGVLNILLVLGMVFILSKKSFQKLLEIKSTTQTQSQEGEEKQANDINYNDLPLKGFTVHIILSLALIWSFLSFPMIYWNRHGEGFSLEPLPFPLPIYAYYHFFLLASVLGVFLITYLLSLFTNKGEVVQLVKRGVTLRKKGKWSHLAFLILPALIYLFYLCMDFFNIVPQVDWLILVITYPLAAAMLLLIPPIAEKKSSSVKEVSQASLSTGLLQINLLLITAWGFWFLPIFLTVKLNQTYLLLLLSLSISMIGFSLYETLKG
ncbi:MAG: carcinine hydrolase/isopenicillin-N N-acyltransferase family protein [Promethearchaeota archaeon]